MGINYDEINRLEKVNELNTLEEKLRLIFMWAKQNVIKQREFINLIKHVTEVVILI